MRLKTNLNIIKEKVNVDRFKITLITTSNCDSFCLLFFVLPLVEKLKKESPQSANQVALDDKENFFNKLETKAKYLNLQMDQSISSLPSAPPLSECGLENTSSDSTSTDNNECFEVSLII